MTQPGRPKEQQWWIQSTGKGKAMAEFAIATDQQIGTLTLNVTLKANEYGDIYAELESIPDKAITTERLWQVQLKGINWEDFGDEIYNKLEEAYGRRPNKQ